MQSDRRNNARLSIIGGSRFLVIQNRPSRQAQLGPVGTHNKKRGSEPLAKPLQPITKFKTPPHFASHQAKFRLPPQNTSLINDDWIALFIARSNSIRPPEFAPAPLARSDRSATFKKCTLRFPPSRQRRVQT
jgi:hypothetical protein